MLTGRGIPTQDLRIGTLYAARKDSVPFADLLRRVKLERVRLKRCQLSNQRCRLLGYIAMPLKGKCAEIEKLQPLSCATVKHGMLCDLPPSPEISNLASFVLAAWII